MTRSKTTWAIETRYVDIDGTDYNSFVGVGWFVYSVPACMSGSTTALFKTRQDARKHLPETKAAFPRARVVKVELAITTIGAG